MTSGPRWKLLTDGLGMYAGIAIAIRQRVHRATGIPAAEFADEPGDRRGVRGWGSAKARGALGLAGPEHPGSFGPNWINCPGRDGQRRAARHRRRWPPPVSARSWWAAPTG